MTRVCELRRKDVPNGREAFDALFRGLAMADLANRMWERCVEVK
jgi:hypothetical protein